MIPKSNKNETKLESAYYWTVGWFSYLSDFSTFKKMASYYSEYKRDLVTFKADINNFIKDINFVKIIKYLMET